MTTNYSPTQQKGFKAEIKARDFLIKHGYTHTISNFRSYFGEIDLIVETGTTLVFVEVRLRQRVNWMRPSDSIDHKKQLKLIKTAQTYLQLFPTHKNCRFDVILLEGDADHQEILWIKDAFQVQ